MMAFPGLLLAIALSAIFQPSLIIVAIVIALVNWVSIARVIYTETTSIAERDFVVAAYGLGARPSRILVHHILPHLVPTILVWTTLGIATTVLLEATLSYLGIGVRPPIPDWGNIIFENQTYFSSAPWLVFSPGFAIALLAFSSIPRAMRCATSSIHASWGKAADAALPRLAHRPSRRYRARYRRDYLCSALPCAG